MSPVTHVHRGVNALGDRILSLNRDLSVRSESRDRHACARLLRLHPSFAGFPTKCQRSRSWSAYGWCRWRLVSELKLGFDRPWNSVRQSFALLAADVRCALAALFQSRDRSSPGHAGGESRLGPMPRIASTPK